MKIADNVEMLEIPSDEGAMYPVLTWDDNEVVLIDTGLPGQIELLRAAVSQAGFALEKITKVIITHHDMDHIGCAKILAGLGAKILAHEIEAPYIEGEKTAVKLTEMEERIDKLSEDERAYYDQVKEGAPQFYVHVDELLKSGERLNFCGGIKVLHSPGHVPGHISLLLKESNILVAGDAAGISEGGELTGSSPIYTHDMAEADASFKKIMATDPSLVVCYHGGLYRNKK